MPTVKFRNFAAKVRRVTRGLVTVKQGNTADLKSAETAGHLPVSTERSVRSLEHLKAEMRRERDEFLHEDLLILGSGPSILELSADELLIASRMPTIGMNRYLLFWEKIGIWPTYFFLADTLGVGLQVFVKSLERIEFESDRPSPSFIVEDFYRNCVPSPSSAIFFNRDDRRGSNLEWASNPYEPMFFHRGSLTSLLNVISAYRLAKRVFMIGVDLNRPGYFFDDLKTEVPSLFNAWDEQASAMGAHATSIDINGWKGSILDHWSVISDNYTQLGMEIVSASRGSQLVSDGLVDYFPLGLAALEIQPKK